VNEYGKVQATATAMQRHGGGFVKALGAALMRADPNNIIRIKVAFSEYWQKYRSIAEKHEWYMHE
jgi:hypothetical protein